MKSHLAITDTFAGEREHMGQRENIASLLMDFVIAQLSGNCERCLAVDFLQVLAHYVPGP